MQGGKYRIERVLGQGGFGNTYVGYNTKFEETVAIKEFFMKGVTERDETTCADNVAQFEEQREKFKKEARRLRKLKNRHIVKVHDLFEENGTAYYVMDFIDGESLAEKMKRTGQAMTEKLVIWMIQPKRKKRPQSVDEVLKRLDKNVGQAIDSRASEQGNEETIVAGHEEETVLEAANPPVQKGGYRAVDLGLSVLWAEFNVGTDSINSQGGLYGWGDPTGKKTSTDVADYVPLRKYLSRQIEGDMGLSDYDIATVQWGDRWRMPNRKHREELIRKCQWVKVKQGHLEGYRVWGPNGNTIFLPFTGIRFENEITNVHSGYYWTSELAEDDRTCAHYFYFDVEMRNDNVNTRNFVYSGRAVRAVCEKCQCE